MRRDAGMGRALDMDLGPGLCDSGTLPRPRSGPGHHRQRRAARSSCRHSTSLTTTFTAFSPSPPVALRGVARRYIYIKTPPLVLLDCLRRVHRVHRVHRVRSF